MQHDLEKLGPFGFQDLAAALAVAVCGRHVQVLGSGRDGGRDMFCKGTILWSASNDAKAEVWDGYTVFQVKHKERLAAQPSDNMSWLWKHVKAELDKWADPDSGRGQVPDYLVIVSNVPLTPVPKTGGLAQLDKSIKTYIEALSDGSRDVDTAATERRKSKQRRMARLRSWRIWDGNQIDGLVTAYEGIRRAFGAFLTAPDVFAHLADFTDKLPLGELESGLHRQARMALMGDRSIYFDDAGSGDGAGIPIEEVAIDLPITSDADGKPRTVFGYVLDRGERVLKPRLNLHTGPKHIVVAGGPGNGKTTMSKFLVQVYRAALLENGSDLGTDHRAVIDATAQTVRGMGRDGLPKHRRWPIRIDLAEYAEEQGLSEDSTLLRWIALKVSKRLNLGAVSAGALDSWMKQWPWFLVLDGLDEVTEPRIRKRLIAQITEFVSEADGDNCDLLVVVTTRPTGYVENIAPTQFERVDLSRLEVDQAVRYGIRATRVRLGDDTDKIDRITGQLRRAAETESLRNLMQTPLQVLIMTIIVEGAGRLAPDRYSLFWGYYETVLKRERAKPMAFAQLLQEYSPHILDLHQRVGFELQVRSEESDGSMAAMSPDELRSVAWQVLREAGFHPSDTDSGLLDQIVAAATHRLVLLAPRGEEGLGFDVRSLQELMAARFLITGPIDAALARLKITAESPHWRNAWVFAAGNLFSEPQQHQHEALVSLVEKIDDDASSRLGRVCPIGPTLALDLIDDGMARAQPRFHDRLLTVAFTIMHAPCQLYTSP
ncbi:NACHT domain-containing protein, partial [Rhodococcus globerulus]|uniref:NACHT domain-containing protein n=1 Tax=Rhodococcus globerulus TaxID=33008 RepID=UPI001F301B7D